MITAMNRIYVVPEYAEQFEQRFRRRARLVDGMAFLRKNEFLFSSHDHGDSSSSCLAV